MKKIHLLILVFAFVIINKHYAQETLDLSVAKAAIQELINIQNDSLIKFEKKKIDKLFSLTIDKKNNNDRLEFGFGPLRIFRFYIYTLKGKAKLRLWQTKDGSSMHHETEKVLLEWIEDDSKQGISYCDYTEDKLNDFAIELESVGEENTCAVVQMVQIIDNGKRYFYPKEKKCVIIIENEGAENDTIIRYF